MVLRSVKGSAQDMETQTFHPLGVAKGSAKGQRGSAFAVGDDAGTNATPRNAVAVPDVASNVNGDAGPAPRSVTWYRLLGKLAPWASVANNTIF